MPNDNEFHIGDAVVVVKDHYTSGEDELHDNYSITTIGSIGTVVPDAFESRPFPHSIKVKFFARDNTRIRAITQYLGSDGDNSCVFHIRTDCLELYERLSPEEQSRKNVERKYKELIGKITFLWERQYYNRVTLKGEPHYEPQPSDVSVQAHIIDVLENISEPEDDSDSPSF